MIWHWILGFVALAIITFGCSMFDLWWHERKLPTESEEEILGKIREASEKLNGKLTYTEQTMWLDYREHWENELHKLRKHGKKTSNN